MMTEATAQIARSRDPAPAMAAPGSSAPRAGHAQLTNMALCMRTLVDCQEAPAHAPRLGLFYGFSGYGKTVSAAFAAAHTGAAYIEARSIWTQRSILEAIGEELGIARLERTAPRMLQQIINQLNYEPRALIIDEFDHLVAKKSVEIIRDIHEATRIAVLMIGEEALPAKLKAWERFDNRILVATAAQPSTFEDARKLRDHYCTRVTIDDDLADFFCERCKGVTRRIVINLEAAQRLAVQQGVMHVGLKWWGNRPVQTGELTVRRKAG